MPNLPRAERKNLFLAASVEAGDLRVPVRIRNLSETGAMIDGAALPEAGTALVLRRMEVEIGAVAIWREKGRCGIKFDGIVSVDEWVAGVVRQPSRSLNHGQARVDAIFAAVRSGASLDDEEVEPPHTGIGRLDEHLAEELTYVARLLDAVGDDLSEDPIIIQRYSKTLQTFDLACQILAHLGVILGSADREAAVNRVTLAELRARLLR